MKLVERLVDDELGKRWVLILIAEHEGQEAVYDDPGWDGTDGAHPAWWRGNDDGWLTSYEKITKILDGKDEGHGWFREPFESLRRRLIETSRLAKEYLKEWPGEPRL